MTVKKHKGLKRGELTRASRETGISLSVMTRLRDQGILAEYCDKKGVIDTEKLKKNISQYIHEGQRQGVKRRWAAQKGKKKRQAKEQADEIVNNNSNRAKRDLGLSIGEAQRLKANYDAALKELEYKTKTKELLPAEQVKREAIEVAMLVKNTLLSIPERLGPVLAAESSAKEVKKILKNELRQVLEALSEDV